MGVFQNLIAMMCIVDKEVLLGENMERQNGFLQAKVSDKGSFHPFTVSVQFTHRKYHMESQTRFK